MKRYHPCWQGRSQGGAVAPHSFDNPFLKMLKSGYNADWGGGGECEVKRDHTLRKLWIDHLHKARNCSLEALEFSIFLGCYLSTPPPCPPKIRGLATPLPVGDSGLKVDQHYFITLFT